MIEMDAVCTSGCDLPLQTLSNMEQLAAIDGIGTICINLTWSNMFDLPCDLRIIIVSRPAD